MGFGSEEEDRNNIEEILNEIELPYLRDRAIFNHTRSRTRYEGSRSIYSCINNSFYWDRTIEGHSFWSAVHDSYKDDFLGINTTIDLFKVGDVFINGDGRYLVFNIFKRKLIEEPFVKLIHEGNFTRSCISRYSLNHFLGLLDKGVFKYE